MIYAIGDIHGKARLLKGALAFLEPFLLTPEDTVVFLGDYIDRGEDSRGVLEQCLEFARRHKATVFLRGNHEQMLLDCWNDETPTPQVSGMTVTQGWEMWLRNGGGETLASYAPDRQLRVAQLASPWKQVPLAHLDFIEATRLEYHAEGYCFVHAGLPPADGAWEHAALGLDPRLWIREAFLNHTEPRTEVVVFGHTPQPERVPRIEADKIGLDTGAFILGGRLTLARLDTRALGEPARLAYWQWGEDAGGAVVHFPIQMVEGPPCVAP